MGEISVGVVEGTERGRGDEEMAAFGGVVARNGDWLPDRGVGIVDVELVAEERSVAGGGGAIHRDFGGQRGGAEDLGEAGALEGGDLIEGVGCGG